MVSNEINSVSLEHSQAITFLIISFDSATLNDCSVDKNAFNSLKILQILMIKSQDRWMNLIHDTLHTEDIRL